MEKHIRDHHPEERARELLLNAAKVLFARKGFDGTSVKDLAELAGVNVSLVSYHFGGKKELYRACIETWGKERLAIAQRVLRLPQSIEEFNVRLRMMVEEVVNKQMEEPEVCAIIHREAESSEPLIDDVFRDTFLKSFQTLVEFFGEARKRGFVRSDVDPLLAASALFGSIFHFIRMDCIGERYFDRTLKDLSYRKKVVDHLVDIHLKGILS